MVTRSQRPSLTWRVRQGAYTPASQASQVSAGWDVVPGEVMTNRACGLIGLILLLLATNLPAAPAEQGEKLSLRIEEAVLLALERNLDLMIERIEPLVAHEQIRQVAGDFDPSLKLSAVWKEQKLPINSALEQGGNIDVIKERSFTPTTGVTGKLTPGTEYSLSLVAPAVKTNNPNRLFDLYYPPVLIFGVTQPLLKDLGIEVNLVRFRQAEQIERMASLGVEAKMLSVILDVETNYWTLFFAQQHLGVTESSLELALDLEARLRRKLGAGLATTLNVREAEASVEARRGDLLQAQADLLKAQARLRLLVNPDWELRTRIVAAETPPAEGAPTDLEERLAEAMATRPEPRRQKLLIENLVLEETLAKNNTLPRLDFIGSLGYTGLAGSGTGPRITNVPARLQGRGSYTEAFDEFFTPSGNITWSAGLQVQMPLGSRGALGALEQARLRQQQERVRLTLLNNQIALDVQTAFQDMTAAWGQVAATDEGVKLAREQLDAAERQFSAGLATVRQVLEAQDTLSTAQDKRIQALGNYSTARSRLAAAAGASLHSYHIVIQP